MARNHIPATSAIRQLNDLGVAYRLFSYRYRDKGGANQAAVELKLEPHQVIKTLVMEDDSGNPLIVLMHGDRQVSTKTLARALRVKSIHPCDPRKVERLTGYQVGGVSPFGIHPSIPIYIESGIMELSEIYLNAGKRGCLVRIRTEDVMRSLNPLPVHVGIPLSG
jgi:Cys-tRNA(Pro) deacylase